MIIPIPALDIINGQCVRLSQGNFSNKLIYGNPCELAKIYAENGFKRLHLVDLDGAKNGTPQHINILENIVHSTQLEVDFSGGIRTPQDIENVFSAGATQIILGSMAINTPEMFYSYLTKYGSDKIILAADFKGKFIVCHGWQENSQIELETILHEFSLKNGAFTLCTDISRDGMLQGSANKVYIKLQKKFPKLKFIASGGVSSIDDISDLDQNHIYAVVIGKALLEGRIKFSQLKKFL